MTKETAHKEELTLDELVTATQIAWTRFRNAQLHAFCAAAALLMWARENEDRFVVYCKRNSVSGQELETRVVELMLASDPDGEAILRERRAEYGSCVGWFADRELCPETDPEKAVALARQKGRMTGIAQEYREKKDAKNPKAKAAKQKVQATKARDRTGTPSGKQPGSASEKPETVTAALKPEAEAHKPEFLKPPEGDPDADTDALGAASGIDPLEPIVPDPAPPKLGISDEKKRKAREIAELVFHPRNTVADTVNFVRAYHRIAHGWLPSDLGIGSYEQQLATMRENLRNAVNDARRKGERIDELERENSRLREEIGSLQADLDEAA